MFPKQPNVVVPVFKADIPFLTKLDQILNTPTNHYSFPWREHYMTVEIKDQSIFLRFLHHNLMICGYQTRVIMELL
jgi:hypothetical protein